MLSIFLIITITLILIVLYFIYYKLTWKKEKFAATSPGTLDQLVARDVQDRYEIGY